MRSLLYNAQNGDQDAAFLLVEKFEPLIKKYAKQLSYYCAETDLVIALLELIASIDLNKFEDGHDGEVVNYIYITLRNKKIDFHRKSKLHAIEEIHIEPEIFTYIQTADSLNINSPWDWTSLLNDLSEKQRFVIIQKYIIGFSDVEIAERMNISRQAVNRLINRALENLRNNSKVKIYEGR